MNKGPLDELFEEVLKEGNTTNLWSLLDPDAMSANACNMALFRQPPLARALHRFVEENRLPIATAHCRWMLRRLGGSFRIRIVRKRGVKAPSDESPGNWSVSAP